MRHVCYLCRQTVSGEPVELDRCDRCGAEAFLCLDCDSKPPSAARVAVELWKSQHVCPDERAAHLVMASARIRRGVTDLHEARHLLDACGLYELSGSLSQAITVSDNARERVRELGAGGPH